MSILHTTAALRQRPGQASTVLGAMLLLGVVGASAQTASNPCAYQEIDINKYGHFVMHCHILDHEDLGMMEVVEVVDERRGVATGHQH